MVFMAGFINKILDVMKLSNDDEYTDVYDEDIYDEEMYDEPEEIEAEIDVKERKRQEKLEKKRRKAEQKKLVEEDTFAETAKSRSTKTSNVVMMEGGKNLENMEVCMICPKSDEDKRRIADTLLDGKSIVINMEGLDMDLAQSIMDFTSGACYAINGNMNGISKYILIATPKSVDLSGEFADVHQNEKRVDF
jgi:cell division inhibitor SepF